MLCKGHYMENFIFQGFYYIRNYIPNTYNFPNIPWQQFMTEVVILNKTHAEWVELSGLHVLGSQCTNYKRTLPSSLTTFQLYK